MCWRSLRDHDVSGLGHDSHSVRVQELAVPLADFSELELEVPLLVEDLDPVVVGVRHDDLVVLGDCDSTWLRELTLQDAKLSELAVVDHLLTSDLGLWWIGDGSRWHWGGQGSLRESTMRDGTSDGRDKFSRPQSWR